MPKCPSRWGWESSPAHKAAKKTPAWTWLRRVPGSSQQDSTKRSCTLPTCIARRYCSSSSNHRRNDGSPLGDLRNPVAETCLLAAVKDDGRDHAPLDRPLSAVCAKLRRCFGIDSPSSALTKEKKDNMIFSGNTRFLWAFEEIFRTVRGTPKPRNNWRSTNFLISADFIPISLHLCASSVTPKNRKNWR